MYESVFVLPRPFFLSANRFAAASMFLVRTFSPIVWRM